MALSSNLTTSWSVHGCSLEQVTRNSQLQQGMCWVPLVRAKLAIHIEEQSPEPTAVPGLPRTHTLLAEPAFVLNRERGIRCCQTSLVVAYLPKNKRIWHAKIQLPSPPQPQHLPSKKSLETPIQIKWQPSLSKIVKLGQHLSNVYGQLS